MQPILLINPNGSKATTDAMCALARQHFANVHGWTNPNGPPMITNVAALDKAARDIAGADLPAASGLLVAAFGDPGAAALAQKYALPITGIGASAARAAARTGKPFAVATTTPDLEKPIDSLMQSEAGGAAYLGCFFTKGNPEALLSDQGRFDAALIEAAKTAERAGAVSVIIGGGPLAEAAKRIAPHVGARLIHPLDEACNDLKRRLEG